MLKIKIILFESIINHKIIDIKIFLQIYVYFVHKVVLLILYRCANCNFYQLQF